MEGDAFQKLFLNFYWVVLISKAKFSGDAADVGVDNHAFRGVPDFAEDDVGGLSSHTRNLDQLLHGVGDFAVVLGDYPDGRAFEGF